ncbi:hypothetical protein KIH74_35450, partial [Kineosporia sp. J2-2]
MLLPEPGNTTEPPVLSGTDALSEPGASTGTGFPADEHALFGPGLPDDLAAGVSLPATPNQSRTDAMRWLGRPGPRRVHARHVQAMQRLRELGMNDRPTGQELAGAIGAPAADLLDVAALAAEVYGPDFGRDELRAMSVLYRITAGHPGLVRAPGLRTPDDTVSVEHLRQLVAQAPAVAEPQPLVEVDRVLEGPRPAVDLEVRDLADAAGDLAGARTAPDAIALYAAWQERSRRLTAFLAYEVAQRVQRVAEVREHLGLRPDRAQEYHDRIDSALHRIVTASGAATVLEIRDRTAVREGMRALDGAVRDFYAGLVQDERMFRADRDIADLRDLLNTVYGPPGGHPPTAEPGPLTSSDVARYRATLTEYEAELTHLRGLEPDAGVVGEILAVDAKVDQIADAVRQGSAPQPENALPHGLLAAGVAAPSMAASTVEDTPAPERRAPGRVILQSAASAPWGQPGALPVPWGEMGHVVRVGDAEMQQFAEVAAAAVTALGDQVPPELRDLITENLPASMERIGTVQPPYQAGLLEHVTNGYQDRMPAWDAGRELASPHGITLVPGVTLSLDPGPLHSYGHLTYHRPETQQRLPLGARPTQSLDLPKFEMGSTFADSWDGRSLHTSVTAGGPLPAGGALRGGAGLSGGASTVHGRYEGGVIMGEQQILHNQFAYFTTSPAVGGEGTPGSRWRLTDSRGGRTVVHTAPQEMLLAFPDNESPEVAPAHETQPHEPVTDPLDILPPVPSPDTPGTLYSLPDTASDAQRSFLHETTSRVRATDESITVPELATGSPGDPLTHLGRRLPDAGDALIERLTEVYRDSGLFRQRLEIFGSGAFTTQLPVNRSGDWVALKLRGRVTSAVAIDQSVANQQQDMRHLFWAGLTKSYQSSAGGDVRASASSPSFEGTQDETLSAGASASGGVSGSVGRSLNTSLGGGDWRYVNSEEPTRTYLLTAVLETDVRSSVPAARGSFHSQVTRFVRIGISQVARFERELRAVVAATDDETLTQTLTQLPQDGRHHADRMPPPGLRAGRSRGIAVVDLIGGFGQVAGRMWDLVEGMLRERNEDPLIDDELGPWQMHHLEKAIHQRFSPMHGFSYIAQMISHRYAVSEYVPVAHGRLWIPMTVSLAHDGQWTAGVSELASISHYPIQYTDHGNTERITSAVIASGHADLGGTPADATPHDGTVTDARGGAGYTYRNQRSQETTARTGYWGSEGLEMAGRLRDFLFRTRLHLTARVEFQQVTARGGATAAVLRRAGGQVARGVVPTAPQWSARREDTIDGMMRARVPEGLAPLTGAAPHDPPLISSPLTGLGQVQWLVRPATTEAPAASAGHGSAAGPLMPLNGRSLADGSGQEQVPVLSPVPEDDLGTEILGVPDLLATVEQLLQQAGLPEAAYADTLGTLINEDQLLSRLMFDQDVVQATRHIAPGALSNRHAVITLVAVPWGEVEEPGSELMQRSVMVDSESAVLSVMQSVRTQMADAGLSDLAIEQLAGLAGSGSGAHHLSGIVRTRIESNESLLGQWIYRQGHRHGPVRSGMVWDVSVTSWDANLLAGRLAAKLGTARLSVTGGLSLLRPRALPQATRAASVPVSVSGAELSGFADTHAVDFLHRGPGQANELRARVAAILGALGVDSNESHWTVEGNDGTWGEVGVPVGLAAVLDRAHVLGHSGTLDGPGLFLHHTAAPAGRVENVTLVIRLIDPEDPKDDLLTWSRSESGSWFFYKLNTQRAAERGRRTAQASTGGSIGTSGLPVVEQMTGAWLNMVSSSGWYSTRIHHVGQILRMRDVFSHHGTVHTYQGTRFLAVSAYRGAAASKPVAAASFGLAQPALDLVFDPGRPGQGATEAHGTVPMRFSVDVPETVLRSGLHPFGRTAVRVEVPPGLEDDASAVLALGTRPRREFPVLRAEILDRAVIPVKAGGRALRRLFDSTMQSLAGQQITGDDRMPVLTRLDDGAVSGLMTATGVPFEAYGAVVGPANTVATLHLTLGGGHTYPAMNRENGHVTDARGELKITHRLYDARPIDWIHASGLHEIVGMAEDGDLFWFGDSLGAGLDGAVSGPAGPVSLNSGAGGGISSGQDRGTNSLERRPVPDSFRRTAWLMRIQAGFLVMQEFRARQQRGGIRYGDQTRVEAYFLDDAMTLVLPMETAVARRLLHPRLGAPTAHGRWLPDLPVTAPEDGTPAAEAELARLRAAYAAPRYGDWFPVAGTFVVDRAGGPGWVRMTSTGTDGLAFVEMLDPEEFGDRLGEVLEDQRRPVYLLMGGVSGEYAQRAARRSGLDILRTPDTFVQGTDVVAVRPDGSPGTVVLHRADGTPARTYGPNLENVLTPLRPGEQRRTLEHVVPWDLRGPRHADPTGLMTPNPPVRWEASLATGSEDARQDVIQTRGTGSPPENGSDLGGELFEILTADQERVPESDTHGDHAPPGAENPAARGSAGVKRDPARNLLWREYTAPQVPEHVIVLGRHSSDSALDLGRIPVEPGRKALVLALDDDLLSATPPVADKIVEKVTAAAGDGVRAWRIYAHGLSDAVVRRLVNELDLDLVFSPGRIGMSTWGTAPQDSLLPGEPFGGWVRVRPYRPGVAGQAWLVDHLGPDFVAVPAVEEEPAVSAGAVLSDVVSRPIRVSGQAWDVRTGEGWIVIAPQGVSLVPDLVPPVEDDTLVLRVQGDGSDPVVQRLVRGALERSALEDVSRVRLVLGKVEVEAAAALAREFHVEVVFASEVVTFADDGSFLAVVRPMENSDAHRGWFRAYPVDPQQVFRPLREGTDFLEGVIVEDLGQMLFPSSWEEELASRRRSWRVDHVAVPDSDLLDENGERLGTLLGERAVVHAVRTVSGLMLSDIPSAGALALKLPPHPVLPTISVAQVHDGLVAEKKLAAWRLLAPGLTRVVLHDDRRPLQVPGYLPGSNVSARMRMAAVGTSWRPEYDQALDDPTRGTVKLIPALRARWIDRFGGPQPSVEEARRILEGFWDVSADSMAGKVLRRILERAHHRRGGIRIPEDDSGIPVRQRLRSSVKQELSRLRAEGFPEPLSMLIDDLSGRPEQMPEPTVVLEHLQGQEPLGVARDLLETLQGILFADDRNATETVNDRSDDELRHLVLAGIDALGAPDTGADTSGSARLTVLTDLLRAVALRLSAALRTWETPYLARLIDLGDVRLLEARPRIHFVADSDVTAEQAYHTVQLVNAAGSQVFRFTGGFTTRDGHTVFLRLRPLVSASRSELDEAINIRLTTGSDRENAAQVNTDSSVYTLVHEILHNLGLGDRYADKKLSTLQYSRRRLRPGNPLGPTHFRPSRLDLGHAVMSSRTSYFPTLRDARELYELALSAPDALPGGHPVSWLAGYDIPASHQAIVGAIRRRLESLRWFDLLSAVDDAAGDRIAGLPMNHPIVTVSDPRAVFDITDPFANSVQLTTALRMTFDSTWVRVQFTPEATVLGRPPVLVTISGRGERAPLTAGQDGVVESFVVSLVDRPGTSVSPGARALADHSAHSDEAAAVPDRDSDWGDRSFEEWTETMSGDIASGQVVVLVLGGRTADVDVEQIPREPGRVALVVLELGKFAYGDSDAAMERIVDRITVGAREGAQAWRVYAHFLDDSVMRGLVGKLGVDVVYSSGWIALDSLNTLPDPESAEPFGGWSRVRPYRAAGPGQAWLVDDLGPEFTPIPLGNETDRAPMLPGEGEWVVRVPGDGSDVATQERVRRVLGSRSAQDGRPVRLLVGNVPAEVGAGLARDFGVELVFSADELVFHGSGSFVASVRPIGNTDVHRGWLRAYPVETGAVVHPLPEGGVLLDGVVVQRVGEMHYPAALWEGVVESPHRPRQIRQVLEDDIEMLGA